MSTCQEDQMIYHYCSTSGFFNILRNQCLWLTEASFTNDAWENRMLDPIFEQALEDLAEEGEVRRDQLDTARDLYYHHSACFIYLGCFSEAGDILPQWRSYADDGQGFAIGFSSREMDFDCSTVHLNADFANKYYLKKVIYMKEGYAEHFLPLARNWIRMRLNRGKHLNEREIRRAIADDAAFSSLRYYCKDASFASEKELRALWLPVLLKDEEGNMAAGNRKAYRQIHFRPEASRLVPYTEMPFAKSAVREVVLGPKNDMKDHPDILKMFLAANGYDDRNVRIRVSKSSYR
ncbi:MULTISPECIES: DUF2971 domain-containing protein [Acidaminococcus]|jgi:hypothetical protein|uniref:DUF2971 domain-containing protein n=1 Tax=Acidaminococcus fermentans TaxID=905 RepID=A0A6N7W0J5_ACIFE|nr:MULTISPECIES: DUF2971 domain-containing protein [Acidaminococcus]MEE1598982.1 DUF2971 domain-containing protein [Acidaminococcus fermentans]MEE4123244.1 DUF2971 domain-containing protein [Acidaminococcus fermentans]MSS82911.1 DUF2971 domain-containing protein [Acidaminococcus fermentans]CDE92383.1 putative uncharacterized protein [Acidaminococcus sp. CAG:542]